MYSLRVVLQCIDSGGFLPGQFSQSQLLSGSSVPKSPIRPDGKRNMRAADRAAQFLGTTSIDVVKLGSIQAPQVPEIVRGHPIAGESDDVVS